MSVVENPEFAVGDVKNGVRPIAIIDKNGKVIVEMLDDVSKDGTEKVRRVHMQMVGGQSATLNLNDAAMSLVGQAAGTVFGSKNVTSVNSSKSRKTNKLSRTPAVPADKPTGNTLRKTPSVKKIESKSFNGGTGGFAGPNAEITKTKIPKSVNTRNNESKHNDDSDEDSEIGESRFDREEDSFEYDKDGNIEEKDRTQKEQQEERQRIIQAIHQKKIEEQSAREELETKKKNKEAAEKILQQTKEQILQLEEELRKLETDCSNITYQYNAKRNETVDDQTDAIKREKQITGQRREFLNNKIEELKNQIRNIEDELKKLKTKDVFEAQLEKNEEAISKLNSERAKLKRENEECEKRLKEAKEKLKARLEQKTKQEEDLRQYDTAITVAQEELNVITERLRQWKIKNPNEYDIHTNNVIETEILPNKVNVVYAEGKKTEPHLTANNTSTDTQKTPPAEPPRPEQSNKRITSPPPPPPRPTPRPNQTDNTRRLSSRSGTSSIGSRPSTSGNTIGSVRSLQTIHSARDLTFPREKENRSTNNGIGGTRRSSRTPPTFTAPNNKTIQTYDHLNPRNSGKRFDVHVGLGVVPIKFPVRDTQLRKDVHL